MADDTGEAPRFEIFRGASAPTLAEHACMTMEPVTPEMVEGMTAFYEAGSPAGEHVTVPYSRPGMSLTRLWFKSGFPLPLHTHDCDCLYFTLAGSVHLGTEVLEAGDGFFVGADVPYAYSAGQQGAEVLEFRATDSFKIRMLGKSARVWEKAAEQVGAAQERWKNEAPPSHRASADA